MDRPTVYIETSIVSYLAAHPSRDPVTAANQRLTHAWWNERRHEYELYTSDVVIKEAARGNTRMAAARLAILTALPLLRERREVVLLADDIRSRLRLPARAAADALHVAFAAAYGIAYLATWNCTHIANPKLYPRLEQACRLRGLDLPILCTPERLMEE
jgi:predicted nucleic acid-binding protein